MHEIDGVVAAQRAWAVRAGRALTPGSDRFESLADALFGGDLDSATRAELGAGAGGELKRLRSLRSSSALAVNVFRPWRSGPGPVARLLGGDPDCRNLRFEAKFPTGLGGIPPHLDVVLEGAGRTVAIESKFVETYSNAKNEFRPSYFGPGDHWDRLPACRALAERIDRHEESFRWLDAAQLLKHTLGLTRANIGYRLVLAWYRVDGEIADELDHEISRFADSVADDIDFEAITHQDLFERIHRLPEPAPGYFDYLDDRYFPPARTH